MQFKYTRKVLENNVKLARALECKRIAGEIPAMTAERALEMADDGAVGSWSSEIADTLARRVRELETETSKLRLDLATKTEAMDKLAKATKELMDVADNMGYTHNDSGADRIIPEVRKILKETGYGE